MFIVIAILILCGILSGGNHGVHVPNKTSEFFPYGAMGLWTGLIYAFYAFGGIEVMGLMAVHLKKPEEASKKGKLMLATLAIISFQSGLLCFWFRYTRLLNRTVRSLHH